MKKLKFKGAEYTKINTSEIPETYQKEIERLDIKAGNCLYNSYQIAKKITDINIVEGYLVTYFEDGSEIESVGHVWNEYKGAYFDATIGLKQHNRKVKKNDYFLVQKYTAAEANKEKVYLPPKNMYDFSKEVEPTKSNLVFKTDVHKNGIELKDHLNKKR